MKTFCDKEEGIMGLDSRHYPAKAENVEKWWELFRGTDLLVFLEVHAPEKFMKESRPQEWESMSWGILRLGKEEIMLEIRKNMDSKEYEVVTYPRSKKPNSIYQIIDPILSTS